MKIFGIIFNFFVKIQEQANEKDFESGYNLMAGTLLKHGEDSPEVEELRNLASSVDGKNYFDSGIQEAYEAFYAYKKSLKVKIHNFITLQL